MKIYYPTLSDDKKHDQAFVRTAVSTMVEGVKFEEYDCCLIESDNCQHYKSAESFHDSQDFANKWNIPLIRVFGIAGHGKGELSKLLSVGKFELVPSLLVPLTCLIFLPTSSKIRKHPNISFVKLMLVTSSKKEQEQS